MLYATHFRAPDAFVFLESRGRTTILLSDLEVDRGRRQAAVDAVVSYSQIEKKLQRSKKRRPALAKVLAQFLKQQRAKQVVTPADFPLGLARGLKKEKIRLQPADGSLWPRRQIKTAQEIEAL